MLWCKWSRYSTMFSRRKILEDLAIVCEFAVQLFTNIIKNNRAQTSFPLLMNRWSNYAKILLCQNLVQYSDHKSGRYHIAGMVGGGRI